MYLTFALTQQNPASATHTVFFVVELIWLLR